MYIHYDKNMGVLNLKKLLQQKHQSDNEETKNGHLKTPKLDSLLENVIRRKFKIHWERSSCSSSQSGNLYLPPLVVNTANKAVASEMECSGKRKQTQKGKYHHYTPETRAKITKFVCKSGNKAAVKKNSMELGHSAVVVCS